MPPPSKVEKNKMAQAKAKKEVYIPPIKDTSSETFINKKTGLPVSRPQAKNVVAKKKDIDFLQKDPAEIKRAEATTLPKGLNFDFTKLKRSDGTTLSKEDVTGRPTRDPNAARAAKPANSDSRPRRFTPAGSAAKQRPEFIDTATLDGTSSDPAVQKKLKKAEIGAQGAAFVAAIMEPPKFKEYGKNRLTANARKYFEAKEKGPGGSILEKKRTADGLPVEVPIVDYTQDLIAKV